MAGVASSVSSGFNQPPTVKSGETAVQLGDPQRGFGFNQPPTVKSGETARSVLGTAARASFQSAPDGEVGGDPVAWLDDGDLVRCFNQPPTVKSGETGPPPERRARVAVSISPRR